MSSGVLNWTHPNDGAVNYHAVRSSFSTDEAGWKPSEVKRSASIDEIYVDSGLLDTARRSTQDGGVREAAKRSPFRGNFVTWTLPTNIVYGPEDLVTGPQDWSPSKETDSSSEVRKPESPHSQKKFVTLGPAKDYIRRYMKRSISMDDDFGSAGNWFFPAQYNSSLRTPSTSQNSSKSLLKKEQRSPLLAAKVKSTEDIRVVSWGIAKTGPATVKRSPSTDDAKKSGEAKKETWAVPKPVSMSARKSSTDVAINPVKRSPSIDENLRVVASMKRDARAAKRSASKDDEYVMRKVKRSLSTDSVQDPVWTNPKADLSPLKKINFKDEYYNTGLVKRSRSLDGHRTSVLRGILKNDSSPVKVKRSLSIDARTSSTDSSEGGVPFNTKPAAHLTEAGTPKKADEACDVGKVKRSLSTDETVSVKRVTWAIPAESPSIKRSAIRVKRSMSIDWAAGGGMTWIPKSILKETVTRDESMSRDEHLDKRIVKRSSSAARRSPSKMQFGARSASRENEDASMRMTRSTGKGSVGNLKKSNKVAADKISSVKGMRSKISTNPSKQIDVTSKQTKQLVNEATKSRKVEQSATSSSQKDGNGVHVSNKKRDHTAEALPASRSSEKGSSFLKEKTSSQGKTVRDETRKVKPTSRGGAHNSEKDKTAVERDVVGKETASRDRDIRGHKTSKVKRSSSRDEGPSAKEIKRSVSTDVSDRKGGKIVKNGSGTSSSSAKSSTPKDESSTSLELQRLQRKDVTEKKTTSEGKADRDGSSIKVKRSTSKDETSTSVQLKRSASTDAMEKKTTSGEGSVPSKVQRLASRKRQASKEDTAADESKSELSLRDETILASDLKRTASTDAMKEPGSSATETENSLMSMKRTASTDAMKEKKPSSRHERKRTEKEKSNSTSTPFTETESSSSTKKRRSSEKTKNSIPTDNDTSSSTNNTSESKENVAIGQRNKRISSKEDAGRPSKIKRSQSKDDTSGLKDSKRDSGISISEGLSDSESEIEFKPKRRYRKKGKGENYDCAICSKSFRGITDLRRHLLIHANEKPHVCEICNKAYRQNVNLKNHMKVEHSKEMDFVCRFCMKPFPLKQRLKLHLRTHVGDRPFSCPHCPKTFGRSLHLQQHLKSHDPSTKPPRFVPQTTLISSTPEKPTKESATPEKPTQESATPEKPTKEIATPGKPTKESARTKDCVCKLCNLSYDTERGMRHHMNLAHGSLTGFECQICEKQIQEDLATHMKTHAISRPHECEICKAVFAQKTQYNVHMRTHTGERPYQCRVCWQSFGHTNVLKLHIRKHTGEKPFKCVICKQVKIAFSQLSHLKTHMKTIHKEEGAYICEGCRECFKIKFHLDNHVKTCEKVPESRRNLSVEEQRALDKEAETLAQLRYLMAVLLKKISTPEKLKLLGFEKRLIDNVLIAALQIADQKAYDDKTMNELDQMKLNIEAFLEWIVPTEVMDLFKVECPSIESILDKIVSMYLKKGE